MPLTPSDYRVRHAIYEHFAGTGRAPSAAELEAVAALDRPGVHASLDRLADEHLLALEPGTHDIWMAHPFSARESGYAVEGDGRTYHANCGWDALAIPPLLGIDAVIRCVCPDCGERLDVPVRKGAVRHDLLLHFVVPPTRFWDDIGFT